ncbi:hypothetical protein [Ensifer canadensis]
MGEDGAKMYEWFERVGFTFDRAALRREFPDVAFHDFQSWAMAQDWNTVLQGVKDDRAIDHPRKPERRQCDVIPALHRCSKPRTKPWRLKWSFIRRFDIAGGILRQSGSWHHRVHSSCQNTGRRCLSSSDDGVGSAKRDWLASVIDAATVRHPQFRSKALDNERLNSHLKVSKETWTQSKRHGSTS